jgi:integrase
MTASPPHRTIAAPADILSPEAREPAAPVVELAPTPAGLAARAAAQALAKKATAAATLRAYKADWAQFSQWCEAHGFVPVPAAPATVGAYLASLAVSHAPTTIRRRLSALGKVHRFDDLPWNPAHRAIQGPLQGVLRTHGRPVRKAVALTLKMLRQILLTCDQSARGRRDRALLLFGFVGALRRSELVALRVEDVAVVPGGLRLRIRRGKTDQGGRGRRLACRAGDLWKPARCGRLRPGRRWPSEKPGRCSERSAPATGSARRRCIPTRCGGSWRIVRPWPG